MSPRATGGAITHSQERSDMELISERLNIEDYDRHELLYERHWTDGLPIVLPT
jgi:hypothetical protein